MAEDHEDAADGPFLFSGIRDHIARLREVYLHVGDDGELVAWTDDELAAQVRSQGVPMTRGYVQQLSNGVADNPSAAKLVGLSNAFGISPAYFFSATVRRRTNRRLDARLERLRARVLEATERDKDSHTQKGP